MTATFADYCASADAREQIAANVLKWSEMLCEALMDNFKSRNRGKVGGYDAPVYKFYIESGRKYHKLIMDAKGHRSVHCFIDKKTGEVFKSASWKAPAKGVRYNLLSIESREECLARADWAGGYLYNR